MSDQNNAVAEQNLPDDKPPQFVEVCVALKQIFTVPFRDFSIAWKENVLVPEADAEVREMVADNLHSFSRTLRKEVITNVRTYLSKTFILLRVCMFLLDELHDEEFLNLFSAFIDYYETACSVVHELFDRLDTSQLRHDLGNRTVYQYLRFYGLRQLFFSLRFRLKKDSLEMINRIRGSFRYTSSFVYEGLMSSSFVKVTTGFKEFFSKEEYTECMTHFVEDAFDRVTHMLGSNSDRGAEGEEKRFLVTLKCCLDVETGMYRKLYLPTSSQVQEYNEKLTTIFCMGHRWRAQVQSFQDYKKILVSPDVHFDPAILLGLVNMYSAAESDYSKEYALQLQSTVRNAFKEIFQRHAPDNRLSDYAGWPLEAFRRCLEAMAARDAMIKGRINSISDTRMRNILDGWYILGYAKLGSDGDMSSVVESNIIHAQKCIINYICSVDNDVENEYSRLKLIGLFFQFLADKIPFIAKLFVKLQRTYLNSKTINIDRVITFRELPEVGAYISDNIDAFIKDVTQSLSNGQSMGEEIQNAGYPERVRSSFIFRAVDWMELKDTENLLIIPERLIPIRNRVESHMKKMHEPDKEIRPVDALARVTIRTSLFTRNKKRSTRVHLLLYQAMVLKLFGKRDMMTVSEIYKALIREDIADSAQRKRAEDVVNRIIESLREPFPLLATAFDATNPDPSKPVNVNRHFFFESDEVSLLGQTLLGQNPQYSE